MADTAVRIRVADWLFRHPLASVTALLGVIALVALGFAGLVRADDEAAPGSSVARVARSPLPEPTQTPPAGRVKVIHRSLHAMGKACRMSTADRNPESVDRPVAAMLQFARDYPSAGFRIDDEFGSTLSLLVVLRNELTMCAPSLVAAVEELLPEEFRDPG